MDNSSTFIADPNDYIEEMMAYGDWHSALRTVNSTFIADPNDYVDFFMEIAEWHRRKASSR